MTSHLQPQRGMSMIEVLVSMAIGLVMLGAVGYLFMGSKRTSSVQSDLIRMQESARNTMDLTGRALRQAGYKLDVSKPLSIAPLAGTDGGDVPGKLPPSDTIIVYHDPKSVLDTDVPPNPRKGEEADCAGTTVTSNNATDATTGKSPANTNMVAYRFFIKDNKLYCSNTPANLADPGTVVANHVENLQFNYAMRGATEGEVVEQYSADPATKGGFDKVSAVRVSVMVRGPTPNLIQGIEQTITFDDDKLTFKDGYLRQVYTSTFTLRNQTK